jgi:UDP-N-acetylmuramoyl-L-alanyl-D-glutamate--2,6-diaminopimelate ligase
MTQLATLVREAGLEAVALHGDPLVDVSSIEFDSRRVTQGTLFCCVPGERVDGHTFAAAAVRDGAAALVVERLLDLDVPQVVVQSTRAAMGLLAAALHGQPSRSLTMVGVTGTNGKTTTTNMIAAVLRSAGRQVGLIGTLTGVHTTPEAPDLQRQLAAFRDQGADAVVMEVSSHALALERVVGTRFDLAVFTNLGRDHLDLHGSTEAYFQAKAKLFEPALADRAVVNADDAHGRRLLTGAHVPTEQFSLGDATDVQVGATAVSFEWRGVTVRVGIGGDFNVMNALAAATACHALGLSPDEVAAGLAAAPPVAGRFEPVSVGQSFAVIVDYAHTPDGLSEALRSARSAAGEGRLLVVFGCGGDRDRDKRPLMGEVAARLADVVVITSDNPRSESPSAIIDAVRRGVPSDYAGTVVVEPDRRTAMLAAFSLAEAGDVVVVAGKGHEQTQTIGDAVVPFDDRVVARELLETLL